ncbi:uncharacterized protein LOC110852914 [Folsomia candida]|uniref:uncharacterized protein LOC110852914 n=1 Tax=Folsomia candida TaxID=158441 RepID=UPI000B8F107A|nr:uncharacterized protein LOC110852914 [Folsomia candida]
MATLKIQRFVGVQSPSRPGSAGSSSNSALLQTKGKKELERYKEESAYKSEQIMELRKEIVSLQNRLGEIHQQQKVKNPAKMAKSVYLEKEKDWQKKIRGLNQQVRTLQKILYNKDPHNPAAVPNKSTSSDHPDDGEKRLHDEPHVAVLEGRIVELERNLEQADSDAKDRLKDFQAKLNSLKLKYEDQIKETEARLEEYLNKLKLAESAASVGAVAEQQSRLDRAMGEIGHLKQELSRTKRDLEIAQRVTTAPNPNRQQDAGTLSLAIKRFKVELAEKEKDIVRLKKELGELNKTNVTLKRERERYLGSAAPNNVMIPPRIVGRVGNVAVGGRLLGPGSKKGDDNINTGGAKCSANINATVELLQDTLDYERAEFEGLLQHKRREIEERDRIIQSLRKQLASVTPQEKSDFHNLSFSPSDKEALLSDELHRKEALLDELRSRVTSQNEVIIRFKEHLTQLRGSEEKMTRLEREQGEASALIQQLREKLQIAQAMSRPENEILAVLAQKFEDLNTRYLQREDQMKLLLNKLSAQTGTPRSLGYNNNSVAKQGRTSIIEQLCLNLESNSDVDLDLRQLSPSLYEHLFSSRSSGGGGGGRGDPV